MEGQNYRLPRNWKYLRHAVFERDDYACVICGSRANIECDHRIARHQGGSHEMDNLQTLCRSCHIEKTRADKGYSVSYSQIEWERFTNLNEAKKRRLCQREKLLKQ